MLKPGDVVLTSIQFVDTFEIKTRPVLVLYVEYGNIVVAGITSNKLMEGIPITKNDGAIKDCVIKLNYLFTTSEFLVKKILFHLNDEKKKIVYEKIGKRLKGLIE